MKFEKAKKELLKDPQFREEYFKQDLKLIIAKMFIDARLKKGMSQAELAKKMNTQQPSIARVESGEYLPKLKFLKKAARALDTELIPPQFAFLQKNDHQSATSYNTDNSINLTVMQDVGKIFEKSSSKTINTDASNKN